jgi:hypothetical protein
MATKILLRNARAAFVELGAPDFFQGKKQRENDKRSWSVQLLCSPETQASADGGKTWAPAKAVIDAGIQAEAASKWGVKAPGYLLNILPDPKGCCWQDGNRKPDYAGYPGNWSLAAKRTEDKGRPLVYDTDKSPLYQPNNEPFPGKAGRIYGGCYVNASVELWAQENASGKGMRCSLNGVQFLRDGDSFGGGAPANPDDFEDIAQGADADALA